MPDWKEGGGAAATVSCMSEEAMAMGFTVSSQIAQRLANAIMQAFSIELEKREAVFSALESEATKAWLRARTIVSGAAFGLPVQAHLACCSAPWRRGRPAMALGRQCARCCVSHRSKWVRACPSNFRNPVVVSALRVGYAPVTVTG